MREKKEKRLKKGVHLLPPPVAPTEMSRPCAGSHPPHRKNRERRRQHSAGSNGDASVKRRSGVRTSRTQRPRACARREGRPKRERDGGANYYHLAGSYRITHCRRARDHAPAAPRGCSAPLTL